MPSILAFAESEQNRLIAFLRELVQCESPSHDPAAVNRFGGLFADAIADIAEVKQVESKGYGRCLRCEFRLRGPGRLKRGQILAVGHSDTVWPIGTLKSMPWRKADGRLWGPGIFDMKSGLAFFVFAMRALRALDIPVARKVCLWIVSDEEIGSEGSRAMTEREARKSSAVLVLEPAAGLDGKLKTARKGVCRYELKVRGISAHAGLDFEKGASAVLELARQIERISGFTRLERGVTVNAGVIEGGTRSNVVPEFAGTDIDARIPRMKDYAWLEKQFGRLRPIDKRCRLELSGGLNRPPFERTPAVVKLFRVAQKIAAESGVTLGETKVGGGSDGNFTSALGIPTLDGLGGVGEGAHAVTECILVNRIPDRVALLARLVQRLAEAD